MRELGIAPSADYRQVVGLAEHFNYPDASIEVYIVIVSSQLYNARALVTLREAHL